MSHRMRATSFVAICLAAAVSEAAESTFRVEAASFLGGSGDDDNVVGARIQADGTIVLAANLAADCTLAGAKAGGAADHRGTVLRVSRDGQKILSAIRIASAVHGLALDAKDEIYVAAAEAGAIRLPPQADKAAWTARLEGPCVRIDASTDGHCAALAGDKKGAVLLDANGNRLAQIGGSFTDLCIDGASKTVILTSFRNAHAHDGKRNEPVQICSVHGYGYDGQKKWTNYDWSTDRSSDRFINKPTNNMADTRAYRCRIGRDGKLYVGFESAGGNHIFRYSPTNIMEKATVVGGDAFHEFYGGGGASHRTIVGKFDADTGKLHGVQQFTGRTVEGNRCTNVRMKEGGLAADEDGRLFLAGLGGARLPLDLDPLPPGTTAGGPFLWGMTPDLRGRLLCTRMQPNGSAHCVDIRRIDGKIVVVYVGGGAEEGMHVKNPLQKTARGKDGFFVLLQGPLDAPPTHAIKK
jgi:hypothetical protein